jgi:hypothetical protein
MLRHGGQDVDSQLVGEWHVHGHKFDAGLHERRDEGQVTGQAVELGDNELGLVSFAGRQSSRELRALVVLAALNLDKFLDQRPSAAI